MNNSNSAERKKGITLLTLFLVIILSGFFFSLLHIRGIVRVGGGQILKAMRGESSISQIPTAFENYYDGLFSGNSWSLDAFSLSQLALGKREARNFQVLKADSGALYLHGEEGELNKEELQTIADDCRRLYDVTREYGGCFLFVQAPFKNVGQAPELADYSSDRTEERESCLDELIKQSGVPVLDLRDYESCTDYYNTDHHWTTDAAFAASNIIGEEIERLYDIRLERHKYYGNINHYDRVTYRKCFLGSIGIKVGSFFGGRDDFTVLNPKFDTELTLEHYIDHDLQFSFSGSFWEAFINQDLLEDKTYNNKYDANLHGAYVESIIMNQRAENDRKALLITHSYGRSMAQYMCLDYRELRYLDPQKGRFNEDLLMYIREYRPDVVIFMYDDKVNVGDGA